MKTKYTWLELYFADRWPWVRKRAKAFWVRQLPSGLWVRFNDEEMELFRALGVDFSKFKAGPELECEDWRE